MTRNHDKERYDRAKRISQETLDAERAQRAEKTARLRQARLAQRPVESSPAQPQTRRKPIQALKKRSRKVIEVF
ncbi:hypothetical protein EN962_17740 [Mesorhizobium sp. M7A.F.Ca.CA.001.09.2.1]|uniref:Uncharacterized protein n=2 Tax=Mesorhizobium ciceri TaxID=39645 RepID=E8TPD3_MESCW|nr:MULTISPECIES: hypothetical protein [Mesorhizobium]RUY33777.1 hypothetical protein EN981_28855 [Mesorhizobium sp. M7A.F.Ca.CA.001.13.2.1]RUZ71662.1 hypothetical protein EN947_28345 [Mesorhizobium sp. M7A.F.Ca.US.003.02.2.1]ADV15168.1 hypothetical protein Mesci_6172 [Mesorhizobium ciceri biovar biserrulae WSM1271]AMX97922.1 hypothetical protein A4R28_32580 [Mesorhizobium ciceri]MBZ9887265.1 hypothetical protein [Mesorhizobium sp. BR1-1-3]